MSEQSNTLAPDTSPSELQPRRAAKKLFPGRISRKAPSVKTAIILKRLQGQDKTSISKDLGVARNTVTTILEENDVDRIMQDGQVETLKRVPAALRTLDVRLEKNSENAAIWLLDKCFESSKLTRKPDASLTLAIGQLMGNVTVQSPQPQQDTAQPAIDVKHDPQQPTTDK